MGTIGRLLPSEGLHAVKATINHQTSIVTANGWDLIRGEGEDFYLQALAIVNPTHDLEANSTRAATAAIQALIDAAEWEEWGETYSS